MKLIFLGDSMMADYAINKYPITGMVQVLRRFFKEELEFRNFSVPKMSTRTSFDYGKFDEAMKEVDNDSYVIINYGCNDILKDRPERYTTVDEYKTNLNKMIDEILKKGGKPILITPPNLLKLDQNNEIIYANLGDYPNKMIEISEERDIFIIDLYTELYKVFKYHGFENSKRMVMMFSETDYSNYPNGQFDSHFRYDGAYEASRIIVKGLLERNHELTKYLLFKENI